MIKELVNYHFKENKNKYFFFVFVFLVGAFIGGITLYFISESQMSELETYISSFFKLLSKDTSSLNNKDIFNSVLFSELRIYIFLWVLGITAISLIYLISIVFYKGFIFGFTFSFFTIQYGVKGVLFLLIVLVLQNIIKNFALIYACVIALNFKNSIRRNDGNKYSKVNNSTYYFRYTVYLVFAFLFNLLGIYFESYVSTIFIVLFSNLLI